MEAGGRGRSWGKNEKMKCQIPGTVQKCQGEEGEKSVIPQCQGDNFLNSGPSSSLTPEKITPHLEPNLQKMLELVSDLHGRGEHEKKNLIKLPNPFFPPILCLLGRFKNISRSRNIQIGSGVDVFLREGERGDERVTWRKRWRQKGEESPMWCCGWRPLSWRSHLYGVSHDPLPSTPAREKSVAVSMATGSAVRAPEVVVGGTVGPVQSQWCYF